MNRFMKITLRPISPNDLYWLSCQQYRGTVKRVQKHFNFAKMTWRLMLSCLLINNSALLKQRFSKPILNLTFSDRTLQNPLSYV